MTIYDRWQDFPDYIIGITKEIWEDRGVETLDRYYGENIPVRSPMGITRGNAAVKASTMATIHEFPDRELFAEDVIWSNDAQNGHLSSHRLITSGTHLNEGQFGPATGRRWTIRVIADCAAKGETIYDEWLVRDYGGLVRQLGHDPLQFTRDLIAAEGGPDQAVMPFLPENDVDGGYHGIGNDNEWGLRYEQDLTRVMDQDFNHIPTGYDRAAIGQYPGAVELLGREKIAGFWIALRLSFPSATFRASPDRHGCRHARPAPRSGGRLTAPMTVGAFGRPTGVRVHVFGMAHAEYGPWVAPRNRAL